MSDLSSSGTDVPNREALRRQLQRKMVDAIVNRQIADTNQPLAAAAYADAALTVVSPVIGNLEAARAAVIAERDTAREDLREEERAHEETVKARDEAEDWADLLAAALAPADVIGEHSSANNPWAKALEWAERRPASPSESEGGDR